MVCVHHLCIRLMFIDLNDVIHTSLELIALIGHFLDLLGLNKKEEVQSIVLSVFNP